MNVNLEPNIDNYFNSNINDSKLKIELVKSWPMDKKSKSIFREEFSLFVKYQSTIHQDTSKECSFKEFLDLVCSSPLIALSHQGPLSNLNYIDKINSNLIDNIDQLTYGSFHLQYRLDDKLIAVGVIDILTDSVVSSYFFYDPEYKFLNLGVYSALREIALVRQLNKLDSNIKWYSLGYYIHNCKKMSYKVKKKHLFLIFKNDKILFFILKKASFSPSYLLCPEVYTWHPIEYCLELLDKNNYARFATGESLMAFSKKKFCLIL